MAIPPITENARNYHFLSVAVILVFLAVGFVTLPDYGMGWDEVTRWNSGDLKIEYYSQMFQGNGQEMATEMQGDRYPGLFDMTLGLVHRFFGGDRMLLGHGLSLLFGALGLVATGWLATVVFGARTGFLSILLMSVYPNFFGHTMINPKDIPFMAAYTLGLAAILSVATAIRTGGTITLHRFITAGLAIGMAGASRVPGLVLMVLAAPAWILADLWKPGHWNFDPSRIRRIFIGLFTSGLAASGVMLVFFPRLHSQLLAGVARVTETLHSSAAEIPLLFRGEIMNAAEAPRLYAHTFFLISTPVWMLALLMVGIVAIMALLVHITKHSSDEHLLKWLFIAFTVFPWAYILVTRPALHNGIRHMLWAIPPLIILMAVGFQTIDKKVRSISHKLSVLPVVALGGFVLLQIIDLYRMHPYQYVSFNKLAGDPSTVVDRYEGEYWFTSTRHLLEALPAVARDQGFSPSTDSPIKVRVSGPLNSAYPFVPPNFVLVNSFDEADFYVSNTTFRSDLFADGKVVYAIERGGIRLGMIKRIGQDP